MLKTAAGLRAAPRIPSGWPKKLVEALRVGELGLDFLFWCTATSSSLLTNVESEIVVRDFNSKSWRLLTLRRGVSLCKDEREPLKALKEDERVVEDEELANESKERNEFVELVLDDNPDCGGENSKLVALGAKKFESEELDLYLYCFLISSGTVPRPALPLNDRVTP